MAKTKLSEWSATASSNTDINSINIAEGMAPSDVNNAIRELMAQLKDFQTGADGDALTVGGNLTLSSTLTANASVGTAGQVLLSRGAGLSPQWGASFVTGMIMMWSGTIATIPSGWALCDGTGGTPDLRNRFIIGANADDAGVAKTSVTGSATQTGGSKDAVNVSHTHTATVTDPGHLHSGGATPYVNVGSGVFATTPIVANTATATTGITVGISTEGTSGTNANLPPYYALAFIMKT